MKHQHRLALWLAGNPVRALLLAAAQQMSRHKPAADFAAFVENKALRWVCFSKNLHFSRTPKIISKIYKLE
jgi:hypothetical protein